VELIESTYVNAHACREALDKARVRVTPHTAQLCLLDVDTPTGLSTAEAAMRKQKVTLNFREFS
jgi:CTP:molybdopterin cytidylyltransferase MocA